MVLLLVAMGSSNMNIGLSSLRRKRRYSEGEVEVEVEVTAEATRLRICHFAYSLAGKCLLLGLGEGEVEVAADGARMNIWRKSGVRILCYVGCDAPCFMALVEASALQSTRRMNNGPDNRLIDLLRTWLPKLIYVEKTPLQNSHCGG
jgi:hypothetical protein